MSDQQRHEAEHETAYQQGQSVDSLTGLPDMNLFHKLARESASDILARGERPAAIALDLIGLKAFNTQYGRDQGDKLLCAFADELRKHIGERSCSRFAEDHFYAFVPESEVEPKINALFEDFKHANDGRVLPVRAGVYVCHPNEDIAAVGTDRAKIACDLDRKTWESHLMYFNDEMREAEKLRIHVLEAVDRAIAEGWVLPFYQPVVRAATSELCGEEALARWIDPEYGMLSPIQFVPVLEEAGLMYKVDLHIVDCVLADFKTKQERNMPVAPVSINLSQHDFRDLELAAVLSEKADKAGVPHELLSVEVTESTVSADPKRFREQVDELHRAGFKVWMDDFGSGYSSLNTLQDYSFDVVKLDMSFARALEDSQKAREIVKGIINTAERLNVVTLTEGVETHEQAKFLEIIGCVMLQGYYFSSPQPLDVIISRFESGIGIPREASDEHQYWDIVGTTSLTDLTSSIDRETIEGTQLDEFPIGILEHRGNDWRVVRANAPYRVLLDKIGLVPREHSSLQAATFLIKNDEDFDDAIERCLASNYWEIIGGRLDYGTGFQTYVRPIVSGPHADAFLVAAFPTMLGSTLGSYGDVPIAYAVFRVLVNEAGDGLDDMEYVYANEMFCEWGDFDQATLPGVSFLSSWENASTVWFPYCYRAAVLGETVHDVLYSPETDHWLSFNVAPSPIKNCCVYAFSIVDEERRKRDEIVARGDTSECIIDIMNKLSAEGELEDIMQEALKAFGRAVQADRLYVLEMHRRIDGRVFEWCAEGVEPRLSKMQNIPDGDLHHFIMHFADQQIVFADTLEDLGIDDQRELDYLRSKGLTSMLFAQLRVNGRYVGTLGADNYTVDQRMDIKRILNTITPAIAATLANHKLFEDLEWAGLHDDLTELLNRRGIDAAIQGYLEAHPDDPYVLALIDVDDFKLTNDMHGHAAGDEALRALARTIEELFPTDAILGRNGGDELLAMLTGDNVADADELLGRFAHEGLNFAHEGQEFKQTTSIGYVSYPDQAHTLAEAYSMADAALYSVKLSGKANAQRYSPSELNTQYRSQLGFTPRDLAENMPGAAMVHRAGGDGQILFANNEMIKMLDCDDLADFMDYTRGSFRYIPYPNDSVEVYESIVGQVPLDAVGSTFVVDYRVKTKKGKIKHVTETGHLVQVENGDKVFYTLIIDSHER